MFQTTTVQTLAEAAEEIGRDRGRSAGTWYFDHRTDDEGYRRVLQGFAEGDPEVVDSLPTSPLSGEWADDYSIRDLMHDLGFDTDDPEILEDVLTQDEACRGFEDGFYAGAEEEICREARASLGLPVKASAVSEFVSESWDGIYMTWLSEERDDGSRLFKTALRVPGGQLVWTEVDPYGRMSDKTR